jgi:hydrogenase small subunit
MDYSTTAAHLSGSGRKEIGRACVSAAAAVGLPAWAGEKMAERVAAGDPPSVVRLALCECPGCAEPLERAGGDAEGAALLAQLSGIGRPPSDPALDAALARGGFVLVVEGARRRPDGALECPVADEVVGERVRRLADAAVAVVAVGSCAPPPAAAVRVVVERADVVALPGCPVDSGRLLGTVLQLATFGTLPALDAEGRPRLAYGDVVHADCPRRPHFDAGRFAHAWGDAGHRAGLCLYELGCAGPRTAARCTLLPVCEAPGGWPLSTAHPCVGCADQGIGAEPPPLRVVPRPGAPLELAAEDSRGSRG